MRYLPITKAQPNSAVISNFAQQLRDNVFEKLRNYLAHHYGLEQKDLRATTPKIVALPNGAFQSKFVYYIEAASKDYAIPPVTLSVSANCVLLDDIIRYTIVFTATCRHQIIRNYIHIPPAKFTRAVKGHTTRNDCADALFDVIATELERHWSDILHLMVYIRKEATELATLNRLYHHISDLLSEIGESLVQWLGSQLNTNTYRLYTRVTLTDDCVFEVVSALWVKGKEIRCRQTVVCKIAVNISAHDGAPSVVIVARLQLPYMDIIKLTQVTSGFSQETKKVRLVVNSKPIIIHTPITKVFSTEYTNALRTGVTLLYKHMELPAITTNLLNDN